MKTFLQRLGLLFLYAVMWVMDLFDSTEDERVAWRMDWRKLWRSCPMEWL